MTVAQLKERYAAIQKEAAGIEAKLKPLFKKMRSFTKRAAVLSNSMQTESALYKVFPDGHEYADGWNVQIHFRMDELAGIPELIEGIENTLSNIRHTPFKERSTR